MNGFSAPASILRVFLTDTSGDLTSGFGVWIQNGAVFFSLEVSSVCGAVEKKREIRLEMD